MGFYNTKQKLIIRQFHRWLLSFWIIHLLFLPVAYAAYLSFSSLQLAVAMSGSLLVICVIEGIKYIKNRNLVRQTKSGESSVSFFYNFKIMLGWMFYNTLIFSDSAERSGETTFDLLSLLLLFIMAYYCLWAYYYHLNVCQRQVAPLLDKYRSQLLSQTKIA